MALGDPYATLADLKARFDVTDSVDDAAMTQALSSASRAVELHTDRQFNLATSETGRLYEPYSNRLLVVDDFQFAETITVALSDGTAVTTFDAGPTDAINQHGVAWKLRGSWLAERYTVTTRWGWASVPAQVKEATLILASELFKLKDAPFGVAGFGDFGVVRIRDNPKVAALLDPYRLTGPRVL